MLLLDVSSSTESSAGISITLVVTYSEYITDQRFLESFAKVVEVDRNVISEEAEEDSGQAILVSKVISPR